MYGFGVVEILITFVVLLAIFIVFREINCWYWKINESKDGRDNTETKSMDKVLRRYLIGEVSENNVTGNGDFSISRVLLVLKAFQAALGRSYYERK